MNPIGHGTTEGQPEAGVHYPKNLQQFDRFFPDDAACRLYVARLRWPNGFVCRRCSIKAEPWVKGNGLLRCRNCKAETSAIAGTILQDTKKPLRVWFMAIWDVVGYKNGVSALGLQRVLGLGSYESAWAWLHKLRRAMVRPGRDRLSGRVEVDETLVGGPAEGTRGRGTDNALVVIAAEERGRRIGRIRLQRVADASENSLVAFIGEAVELGSVIHTDGWKGYTSLEEHGYEHVVTVLRGRPRSDAHVLMPRVHLVASLLKRWLAGTHQGAVSDDHLNYYLDEFTFRFNRRTSKSRGLLFYRLLQQAAYADPAPYQRLISRDRANHKI